jgi:O-antigen/teichoic acid export membrane protein
VRILAREAKTVASDYDTGSWLKSGPPFMLLGTMQLMNKQTDILMVGLFRSVGEVGIYRVATAILDVMLHPIKKLRENLSDFAKAYD